MGISNKCKTLVLLLGMGSFSSLFAQVQSQPFGIESGMIIYDIRGDTQLTPETNLSVKGSATLHFKEWGEIRAEEVSGFIETKGALQYKEAVQRFQKETRDTITTVDYENEQLLERKKSSIQKDMQSINTAHLEKRGTQKVAGLLCDIWEGVGIEKCIYKGIVLKLQSHVYNFSYVKEAVKVYFDENRTKDCALPDYPMHQFGLFRDNIKTKNTLKLEDLCKVINDVVFEKKIHTQDYKVSDFDDPKRKKFIDRISGDIFEKKKLLLPQLLQSMKKMRECLQTVENPFEANLCRESFTTMKSKSGDDDNEYIILWDEKRKDALLDKVEEEIIDLESRIACVKRSKNIHDLSKCMK